MEDTSSLLDALLVAKKQQATELFGPWDTDDNGRIAIEHLRPLLLSIFPLSPSTAQEGSAAPADHLSVAQVKRAYESVTGRPWAPRPLLSVESTSAQQAHCFQDLAQMGPTLNEVHAIIDCLCRVRAQAKVSSSIESADGKEAASASLLEAHGQSSSNTALSIPASGTVRSSTAVSTAVRGPCPTSDPRVAFLYGSIEAIYRNFCLAAVSPGESVPDRLPVDTAHLVHVAWNVHAHRLKLGEGHALQRLLVAKTASADAATTATDGCPSVTLGAFVKLLCSI
ncbi:hypothetical protein LSCM1_02883 [Leishmania martiniquensis]|uniref:EF-hand domain-containing protein n=1 Tax=Leishmania martiniquensis TaxID=1580590 RepID=A0A836GRZ8_9TRYP|nr:hypothetical protein LSCM1_02883 [Leishmania martiniquensis]